MNGQSPLSITLDETSSPRRCLRDGHDWFPPVESREFIPVISGCLRARCSARHIELPTGTCLRRHPIAEHYGMDGRSVEHPTCPGPA